MTTCHRFNCFFEIGINVGVIQNGFRMNTNVVVDDEFQSGQANTLIWQLCKIKCQLGVAHIHHDFGGNFGHGATNDFGHFGFQQAIVNSPGITLGATHSYQSAVFELFGCISTTHHGRDAQFARNDGSMTGPTTTVCDDGAGTLHDGLPIGVGHVCDQHIASLDLVHFRNTVHQTDRTRSNLLPNGTALCQYSAFAFEFVAQFGCAFGLALHGFGAGLQNVKQAICTIFAPLDVHGATVVFFNNHGVLRQLCNVCVT